MGNYVTKSEFNENMHLKYFIHALSRLNLGFFKSKI